MNYFLTYAERAVTFRKHRTYKRGVRVLKSDKDAPMKPGAADAALAEREKLLANYHREMKHDEEVLLAGRHAHVIKPLRSFLVMMTLNMSDKLLQRLAGVNWFKDCDVQTRRTILRMIDNGICRCRVRNGLPPICDSLPDEPPTAFEVIRKNFACDGEVNT